MFTVVYFITEGTDCEILCHFTTFYCLNTNFFKCLAEINQFLIMPPYGSGGYQLARITGVDTKSDRATAEINYLKRIK